MKNAGRILLRSIAAFLVCALLAPSMAMAKPLKPGVVHERIARAGLGNWAAVQVASGAQFGGRIVSIDAESFGMQLHNDPAITPVFYGDVVYLRTGLTRGGFWAFTAIGAAGAVAFALVAHHEFENFKNSEPAMPAVPATR